jgi:hypothetical protein
MAGLKRHELQKCRLCEKGVMHSGQLTFFKLTVEHHVVNVGAVQRLHGLEQMISPVLASVMGPDEDLSEPVDRPSTFLLCLDCATKRSIAELLEP